jgi:ornithine--oxo-acid transaminase
MARGLLSKETHDTVVRLAPPLAVDRDSLQWAVSQLEEVLDEMDNVRKAS